MIIVYKNSILTYDNIKYKCALGKKGIKDNKVEGDDSTPSGIYTLGKIFFRKDRIKNLKSKKTVISINKNMFWSDDPCSINYNKLIRFKQKQCEYLFRRDNIYDIIIVINYNNNPVLKKKGSAIFLHIAKENYAPTKGCIAVKKKDLIEIISKLEIKEKICIKNNVYMSA